MNHDLVFGRTVKYRVPNCCTRCWNISAAVEKVRCELRYVSSADAAGAKPKQAFLQSRLGAVIATLIVALPSLGMAAAGVDDYLVRQGKKPIINEESTSQYERKLFVTPDEVARFVFLTNGWQVGDSSAAVYRTPSKNGSLPGNFSITATEATGSVRGDHGNVRVRRYDAPLPASTANLLHELWLAVLEASPTDDQAIPCAPTGVFCVTNARGIRLTAVTVYLDENSFCLTLMNLGGSLINYAKLPPSKRAQAAAEIEKESLRLLKRVTKRS